MGREYSIPESWIKTSIDEIILIQKGKKPTRLEEFEFEDSEPYLDIRAFERKEIRQYADKLSSHIIDENDLVMVWDGARSGWVSKGMKGALGSTIARFRPFIMSQKYLYYFLSSQFSYLNTNAKGTGIPHVDPQILWGIKMPFPPLNEQDRIVSKIEELFSDLDNGIANLKLAQNQLKVYRQALLKSAFEGKLTEQWRKENNPEPAEKLLVRIKDERKKRYEQELKDWKEAVRDWEKNGKEEKRPTTPSKPKKYNNVINSDIEKYSNLPTNWKWVKIGECVLKVGDIDHKMPIEQPNGVPYLSTRDIKADGTLNFDNVKSISEKDYKNLSNKIKPTRNDIIFPRYGTIGRNVLVNTDKRFLVSYSCAIIKTIPKLINEKYLYLYTLSPIIKSEIERYVVQTTQANIGISSIENFVFPLCPLDEQNYIVTELEQILSQIDNMESTVNSEILTSQILRQSILKQAFEGQLVEQDPNDEPATELLKRIKVEKRKYLEELKSQKNRNPKKIKSMSNSLIEIIESKFSSIDFTYEDLKAETTMPYEEIKKQLFELLEKRDKLKSVFDESIELIKYQLVK